MTTPADRLALVRLANKWEDEAAKTRNDTLASCAAELARVMGLRWNDGSDGLGRGYERAPSPYDLRGVTRHLKAKGGHDE